MSAHVLLNLLNELRRKRDKMGGYARLVEHFISFRNEFNKLNNTKA